MECEGMETVFGRLKDEQHMIFLVGGLQNQSDGAILRALVTDFRSNTWASRYSRAHLEDTRDRTGVGGSWSHFVQYLVASLRTGDVRLVAGTPPTAKLVAQKAKGMPRISISLSKLFEADASEAMANLALELYNAYDTARGSLANEEERCCQLTEAVAAEQEKNEALQRHMDALTFSKKQKIQMINGKATPAGVSMQTSPDKQVAASTKVANRVVPAYRRAKVRGVLLKDDDDEETEN